ncbi:MAG: TetR/AcrR family transcriptional regulator [Spirochaetales bacterium]|nr:TetR/AcrR family transcriptional regulator [Spirochaetales bacterium]
MTIENLKPAAHWFFYDESDKMGTESEMSDEKYHEKAFEKITAEKRKRIFDIAIAEFSSKGYNAASINTIARDAGISIGGMYRYFKSKEALFMSILDLGYTLLEEALTRILDGGGNIFEKIETMLRVSVEYSKNYREINQIYIDVSTEGLSSLAKKISLKMEGITAKLYHETIADAAKKGLLRKDLHPGIASFCIDNLVMMVQFAYCSDYYMERMKLYAGTAADSEEEMVNGMANFIKNAISAQ